MESENLRDVSSQSCSDSQRPNTSSAWIMATMKWVRKLCDGDEDMMQEVYLRMLRTQYDPSRGAMTTLIPYIVRSVKRRRQLPTVTVQDLPFEREIDDTDYLGLYMRYRDVLTARQRTVMDGLILEGKKKSEYGSRQAVSAVILAAIERMKSAYRSTDEG